MPDDSTSQPPPVTPTPTVPRAYSCRCGRPVFFRNSTCLGCGAALGYDPVARSLLPLDAVAGPEEGTNATAASAAPVFEAAGRRHRRCANLDTPAACNWLVTVDATDPLCVCCRLTRTLPDLTVSPHADWWNRIEMAKRRLVSTLVGLDLPVASKGDDPARGLAFDLLRAPEGGPRVVTGHADGTITLDVEEADDATRETRRHQLHEPYRTLLGHLRHECGHYYWQRLVEPWPEGLEAFRALFGDERADYAQALRHHYENGAPPDWNTRCVSAYASSHPWEDWAETFAHYLHMVDTVDTARSFGLDGERVELSYERFDDRLLQGPTAVGPDFLSLLHSWMELTGVLNELSRSMGVPDFYPFVISAAAVHKLHLVHRMVKDAPRSIPQATNPA